MNAMVLEDSQSIYKSPLRWLEMSDPTPGPHEVRIKILCCAVCRTDLHVIEGDLPPHKRPVIPGHQAVGVVDELGSQCRHLKRGMMVGVAWLNRSCQCCTYCLSDRENLCNSPVFTGYDVNGGFASAMIAPEEFVYEIPQGMDPVKVSPMLCAGIIGYRALRRCELPGKGKLCLFGFGSSAHIVIQLALARGAEVYVITRDEKHQKLAREMGARWAHGTSDGIPSQVDSSILFAPVGELVLPALEVLKKGGTLALAGIHLTDIPVLNYQKHLFHEKQIRSVTANTRKDGRDLFDEVLRFKISAHTTTYALQDANKALQDLKDDRIRGSGVLVV